MAVFLAFLEVQAPILRPRSQTNLPQGPFPQQSRHALLPCHSIKPMASSTMSGRHSEREMVQCF